MFGSSVGLASTLKKVATDQLVMAPFMSFGIINLVAFSQGKRKIEDFRAQLEEQYVEVLINGWRLWPVSLFKVLLEIFLIKQVSFISSSLPLLGVHCTLVHK